MPNIRICLESSYVLNLNYPAPKFPWRSPCSQNRRKLSLGHIVAISQLKMIPHKKITCFPIIKNRKSFQVIRESGVSVKSVIFSQVHDVERITQWGHKFQLQNPVQLDIHSHYSLIRFCVELNTDSFINHKLSSFVLLVPHIVLDLIARTISGLAYKSRMITEKVRQHLHRIATRESSTNVSQISGKICKYL